MSWFLCAKIHLRKVAIRPGKLWHDFFGKSFRSPVYVMLNLHKALLEAKFHQNPDNTEIAFSPIIADFCNELVDNLTKIDEEKDAKKAGSWNNWRKLTNQPYYRERALHHALLNSRWAKMGDEEKRKTAINLLSPFQATEEEIECFIQEVNEKIIPET